MITIKTPGILVITLWFLPSVLTAPNKGFKDCDFFWQISANNDHFIVNSNNLSKYPPESKCRWIINSDRRRQVKCTVAMPKTPGCHGDVLRINDLSNSPDLRICGTHKNIIFTSKTNIIYMVLQSSPTSRGGRFICDIVPDCPCGNLNPLVPKIYGGVNVSLNEFPMMALIVDSINSTLCGATIINKKQVITAAHCLYKLTPATMKIVVGEHDTSRSDETDATRFHEVHSFTIHKDYTANLDNDIAIINILNEIEFNSRVGPVCLPFNHRFSDYENKPVEILGWGSTSAVLPQSDVLFKGKVKITSHSTCSSHYNGTTSKSICTWAPKTDTCQYDSGGPVLWHNPATDKRVLIGVISNGKLCESAVPGRNTHITEFLDWIESNRPETVDPYCKHG